MAKFEDHIHRALENRRFLASINQLNPRSYEWEVTVCFYTALHFVNAHLAKFDLHFRAHESVKAQISPVEPLAVAKMPEGAFTAYGSLFSLSRRARYLIADQGSGNDQHAYLTNEKHVAKAISKLNEVMEWFEATYPGHIPEECLIRCREISIHQKFAFFQMTF